jgi:hypothetical protein
MANIFSPVWEEKNGDLYSVDVAESKHGKQHALPPTTVKGERFEARVVVIVVVVVVVIGCVESAHGYCPRAQKMKNWGAKKHPNFKPT